MAEKSWVKRVLGLGVIGGALALGAKEMKKDGHDQPETSTVEPTRAQAKPIEGHSEHQSEIRFTQQELEEVGKIIFREISGQVLEHHTRNAQNPRIQHPSFPSLYDNAYYAHLGEVNDELTATINGDLGDVLIDQHQGGRVNELLLEGASPFRSPEARKAIQQATIQEAREQLRSEQEGEHTDPDRVAFLENMLRPVEASNTASGK